jgi:DNA-binding transcriptional ArsR family regulator
MKRTSAVEAFSALAHDSRLAIIRLLVPEGPDGLPAGEIGRKLAIPASALTFHLTRLRSAGLISVRRNGQQMIYAACYDEMQHLMGFLSENCCRLDARGCSPDCPQPLPTRKKQKRTRQKIPAT